MLVQGWIGASVRFEVVNRSAALLGFLNFIHRSFFVRTVRAAQGKFAPDHCKYSADNADSIIATINEYGTFHGMGLIR